MKTNLRISHTTYPDGTVLYPYKESKAKKSNTEIAIIIIVLTNVVLISVLLVNYLIYNFFRF